MPCQYREQIEKQSDRIAALEAALAKAEGERNEARRALQQALEGRKVRR